MPEYHVATIFMPGSIRMKGVPGKTAKGTFSDFCDRVKTEAAGSAIPKIDGGYWISAVTSDGLRLKGHAQALTLLALDSDSGTDWSKLLAHLDLIGLDYCMYETPSSIPEKRKWRCVLPLRYPVDLRTDALRQQWRTDYLYLAQHFGRIAGTTFDPALAVPTQAIFWPRRQAADDPIRQVVVNIDGAELDIKPMLAGKPKVKPQSPVNAVVPITEATDAGKKWLLEHPCPAEGKRHSTWLGKAAVSLVRGCCMPSDLATTLIKSVSGMGDKEVRDYCTWAEKQTGGRGWIAASKQPPKDISALVDAMLDEFEIREPRIKTFTFGDTPGIPGIDILRGRQRGTTKTVEERLARAQKQKDAGSPELCRMAGRAVALGKVLRKEFKVVYQGHGMKERSGHTCGFDQVLGDAVNLRKLGMSHRLCGDLSCPACGPRVIARKVAAALLMPLVESGDDEILIIGPALQDRGVIFRWVATEQGYRNFGQAFRRENRKHLKNMAVNVQRLPSSSTSSGKTVNVHYEDHPPIYLAMKQGTNRIVIYCSLNLSAGQPVTAIKGSSFVFDDDAECYTSGKAERIIAQQNPDLLQQVLEDAKAAVQFRASTVNMLDDDSDDLAAGALVRFEMWSPRSLRLDPDTILKWSHGQAAVALSGRDDDVVCITEAEYIMDDYRASGRVRSVDDEDGSLLYVGGELDAEKYVVAFERMVRRRVVVDDSSSDTGPQGLTPEKEAELAALFD